MIELIIMGGILCMYMCIVQYYLILPKFPKCSLTLVSRLSLSPTFISTTPFNISFRAISSFTPRVISSGLLTSWTISDACKMYAPNGSEGEELGAKQACSGNRPEPTREGAMESMAKSW